MGPNIYVGDILKWIDSKSFPSSIHLIKVLKITKTTIYYYFVASTIRDYRLNPIRDSYHFTIDYFNQGIKKKFITYKKFSPYR